MYFTSNAQSITLFAYHLEQELCIPYKTQELINNIQFKQLDSKVYNFMLLKCLVFKHYCEYFYFSQLKYQKHT